VQISDIRQNYRVLLHIPALQAACSSLGSLINLLYLVEKTGQNSPFSPADEDTYRDLVSGVNAMLSELETALNGVKSIMLVLIASVSNRFVVTRTGLLLSSRSCEGE
jgi:hypothetical protein